VAVTPALEVQRRRRARLSAVTGTGVALLAAVLAVANLLAGRFFFRADWTADSRYKLSRGSVQLVRSLKDPVIIKTYMSAGLPDPMATQGRYLRDLLREYQLAGRGMVRVENVVPEKSEASGQAAQKAGIGPARFNVMSRDQLQVKSGYFGLALYYQDRQDVVPFIQNAETLEYDLSTRMRRLAFPGKKTILLVNGHGEVASEALRNNQQTQPLFDDFTLTEVPLSSATGVSPDAVFVLGPQSEISPPEAAVLEAYIDRGLPVFLAVGRRSVDMRNFFSYVRKTGLEDLLARRGITLGPDTVLDEQCQTVGLQSDQGPLFMTYPPLVVAGDLDKRHPALTSLNALGFPFAGPVTLSTETTGMTFRVLARSSRRSWTFGGYSLAPDTLTGPAESDARGPFNLMVEVTASSPTVRLVVAGASLFADPKMPDPGGNAPFLLALAQWMTQDAALATIPPKAPPNRPLRSLGGMGNSVVKGLGYFFLPVLVPLAAAGHWKRRRTLKTVVPGRYKRGR
jgi:hypothetical protein